MGRPSWTTQPEGAMSFGTKGRALAPSASDIDPYCKAVTMTAAGNITIVPVGNEDADTITFTGCGVGFIPPYQVRRVTACTGTFATVD